MNATSIVSAALSNAVTVTSGGGPDVAFGIDGPLSVWAVFTQRILAFYGNSGNNDAPAPLILLEGRDGTSVGSDIYQLTTNTLQLLGRSLDGPPTILRPQSSYSHAAFYRGGGLHIQGRIVPASDLHPITEAEWLDIERSVRPFSADNATWSAFWSGIRPRIGTTWGDYVRFLHRFAEPFPAEQRAVREMFTYYLTNQPGFRASSIVTGVVLDSTNDAAQVGVEVSFYSVSSNGPVTLAGSAITDASGQFFMPFIAAGEYVAAILATNDLAFDMNQDGREDVVPPTFTVSAGSDLAGQTIYVTQPPPQHPVPNQADAKLAVDSQGVLHAFWFKDDNLWTARNVGGNWIEAKALNTNKVVAFTVGTSANLIDGLAPGLILVWSQANYNSVDLMYSVGQNGPDGYFWSQPIRLTTDLVENASPAVIVRDNGLALISYLKRGVRMQDDTDLYFATINVASGDLLRNDWIMDGATLAKADLGNKQTFGWSKELKIKPMGLDLAFGLEAAGEFTSQDCDAGAGLKLEGSAQITSGDYYFKGSVAGEGTFKFNVDPDQCDWVYQPDSSSANLHVSAALGANNIVFRILASYPPTTAFVNSLEEFINGFAEYCGFQLENSMEIKVTGSLLGAHWPEAPFASFGRPSFNSAEASIGGAIKFAAKNVYGNDLHLLDDGSGNLLTDPDEEPKVNFTLEAGVEIVGKAQIYPSWKAQSITVTPSLILLTPGGWKIPVPSFLTTPQELIIANDAARPANQPPTNFFDLAAKMIFAPETAIGTANVYGSNSVLANVAADLYNDGAPALAKDSFGVPYQIWSREVDPYSGRYGSDLYMADFDGAHWTAPALIPETGGINSRVCAATDLLGRRMAIWVHGTTTVTTNTSLGEFFAARQAVEIYYATFNGGTWSLPQPIVLTPGPDANLQVSTLANGNILAVWTYTDDTGLVHLVSSRWNGSAWSSMEQIATGEIRNPAAQQAGGVTYLVWTQTDRRDDQPELSLFQSVNTGSGWSSPAAFDPQLANSPKAEKQASREIVLAKTIGGILFGEIPDKCCKCKGRVTSMTNNPPTDCGVSFSRYDYVNCKKIYEYKACPRVSFDPNDIVGPDGFGPERFVGVTSPLNYVIHFENDPLLANAPAKQVVITLPLDSDFDPRTFRLGNFGFGDLSVTVPPGQAFYSTRLDLTETKGFYVEFFAGVDVAKQEAFWRLTTIDPATGGLPINPLLGFLPVNTTKPEGEGFVAFSLLPGATTPQGARVDAKATIVFDTQPPIDTPSIFNTIETGIPSSAMAALPALTNQPNFTISWSGSDDVGGSGIASYDIYVSEDGGAYTLLLEGTPLTEAPFSGEFDTSYAFYSIARDNAGNVESAPLTPDAATFVAHPNTPPVLLNFTNATIIEETLFTRQIEATDTNVPTNSLTFELLSGPAGMSLHPVTGLLSWTPTEAQGPTNTLVIVKVSDDGVPVLSATNQFSITVLETNSPPVFIGPSAFTVDESTNLTFTNVVVDTDIPTNHITLQLVSAPDGVSFDPVTGVVTWTPTEAQGPSTNEIVVQAKDDGVPVFKILRTNTVVVREVNTAPLLAVVTNRTIIPMSTLAIALEAEDSDLPTNQLTFRLGTDVAVPATVDSQTGAFRWKTTLFDAGTTNFLSVVVTDDGTPSLSATQNFVIVVENFVAVSVGSTTLRVNETSGVPIEAIASAPWQTLNFTLQYPEGIFDQLALSNAGPFTAGSISAVDATRSLVTFSNAPGHALQGTQLLAHLTFRAPGTKSAFVPLVPENIVGVRTNEQIFAVTFYEPGRVVVIGSQPLLDALKPVANQHFLTLFGNPGMTYQIDTSTQMEPPITWTYFSEVTLTNVSQRVGGVINPPPTLFYRVRQPE